MAIVDMWASEAGFGPGLSISVTSEIGVMTIVAETDLLAV